MPAEPGESCCPGLTAYCPLLLCGSSLPLQQGWQEDMLSMKSELTSHRSWLCVEVLGDGRV